jgi:FkbM family methyltransferase
MYIQFKDLCKKYGKPRGIIHIGAHLCEERDSYLEEGVKNIVWVEANPTLSEQIKNLVDDNNEIVIQSLLSDTDNVDLDFNITTNGQSSSILQLDKHLIHHPWVGVQSTVKLNSSRMDVLVEKHQIDIKNYDFLNIDVQGAELMVLKGFGNLLSDVNQIYVEVNTAHLYKDCPLLEDIDAYLKSFGFDRVELHMTEWEWGDAHYVRI